MTSDEAINKQRKAMELTMSNLLQLIHAENDKGKKEFLKGYYQAFYDIYTALETILSSEHKNKIIL